MPLAAEILIGLIAALHLYILWLEMFAWETRGPKVFRSVPKDLFAPTKAIWSSDNRTAGYRICGEHSKAVRIECRVGGAESTMSVPVSAGFAAGPRRGGGAVIRAVIESSALPGGSRSAPSHPLGRPLPTT